MYTAKIPGGLVLAAVSCFGALNFVTAAHAADAPQVTYSVRQDVSAPMRDIIASMPPPSTSSGPEYVVPNQFLKPRSADQSDYLRGLSKLGIQVEPMGTPAPAAIVSAEGLSRFVGGQGTPPDTNGDVSPNEYIQWINSSWAIFNKTTGARTSGPTLGNSFFAGFGGACQTDNAGDPMAVWDDRAGRWIMTQFTTTATVAKPASQCFAISTTADPLGTYYRYEFQWPAPVFGDYPHMGIWVDESGRQNAYTLVTHEFSGGFAGAAFIALERDKMLAGQPAAMVRFAGQQNEYGAEPVHMEGTRNAPAGSCPVFVHFDSDTSNYKFFDLCINWTTPASSTLGAVQFVSPNAPFIGNFADQPQKDSAFGLNSFGTHIMYRATARQFAPGAPTNMSLVINHTVLGNNDQGAIRWVHFDLKQPNASFDSIFANGFQTVAPVPQTVVLQKSIVDEGVYAPDNHSRWMGGIAIDGSGDIGLGYSVSSTTINPQIRITGRTADDPAGELRDDQMCTPAVTGAQNAVFGNPGRGRWGDYSSMSVDPSDECTFWFTNEYYATTSSSSNWNTRICSFKFDTCGDATFQLAAQTPRRVEICGATAPADPTYRILAGVINGYSAPVTLGYAGTIPSTTPSFSVNPIARTPGESVLTLTGARSAPSGEYGFSVTGVSGALVKALDLELGVSATAATAATLTAPVNNALGVKVRPTLTWTAPTGALTYLVEVASDAAFTTIVASETVTSNSWSVDVTLNSTTQYYWRVTPSNYCGAGAVSAVSTFTTGAPGVCPIGTTQTNLVTYGFEGGAEPAWTAGVAGDAGGTPWSAGAAIAGTTGFTGNVWKVVNNTVTSDRSVLSPTITIPAAQSVIMTFDTYHSFEDDGPTGCWDSASLELKQDAGAFVQLSGERFFTDSYNGTNSAGAPLAGRQAWCHRASTGTAVKSSIVDLDSFAGHQIQLRFRATSDSNTAAAAPNGMQFDNVKIDLCQ